MALKLVIFDMDGVLIDSEKRYYKLCRYVSDKYDLGLTDEMIYECIGVNMKRYQEIANQRRASGFKQDFFEEMYNKHLNEFVLKYPYVLKKGVLELLDYLDNKHLLKAVATSTSEDKAINQELKPNNIDKRFNYLMFGDNVKKSKPDPEIYLKVLDHFKIKAEEAIVFEDSQNGILSATSAGIKTIRVKDIGLVSDEINNKAIAEVNDINEGITIIEELLNERTISV